MLDGFLKTPRLPTPTWPPALTPPVLSPRFSPRSSSESQTQETRFDETGMDNGVELDTPRMKRPLGEASMACATSYASGRSSTGRSSRSATSCRSSKIAEVNLAMKQILRDEEDESQAEDVASHRCSAHSETEELTFEQHLDMKIDCLIELMLENLKITKAVHRSNKKSLIGPGHDGAFPLRKSHIAQGSVKFNGHDGHLEGMAAIKPLLRMATPHHGMQHAERHAVVGTGRPSVDDSLFRLVSRTSSGSQKTSKIVWRFLEDRSSSIWALAYSYGNDFFLMFSVLLALLEIDEMTNNDDAHPFFMPAQCAIESLFGIEILFRFIACPHRTIFWLNFYNILDATSAIPLILRVISEVLKIQGERDFSQSVEFVSILCCVPVLRLMKLLRRFEHFHLLLSAFRASIEALPVILFTMVLIALTYAAMIFYCEPRSNVPTFLDCLWFVMVTICNVAHGSPAPINWSGKVWTVVIMTTGCLYMAIPIGIVGSAFSHVWEDRHRLLLLMRMRNCVERSGYTPTDLKQIFKLLDKDDDGTLDYQEFATMIDVMQIGVEERFAIEVFESFDANGEGAVDFTELLRGLFPRTHWLIDKVR